MKIYRVGGAVRDALLGLPVQDIDYVVLGSTPEDMVAAGFTPVGKDFPVFLHPKTHAEYALARTERKSLPGYHGFVFHCSPDVTLEQDLQRRDLTINAMAFPDQSAAAELDPAEIVDPYGGQRDLAAKLFRHVSPAFAEDPVRILRVARFSARFPSFTVAPETMQLMRDMVAAGEVDALIAERVWQEIARGLMELSPARMMQVLRESGALARIMPELDHNWTEAISTNNETTKGQQIGQLVDFAAQKGYSLAVRWASLVTVLARDTRIAAADQLNAAQQLCARLKVPTEVRDTSIMALREWHVIRQATTLSAQQIVALFERCDAFRRSQRFFDALQAATIDVPDDEAQNVLNQALAAAQAIPSGQIAQRVAQQFPKQPQKIAEQILLSRIEAVEKLNASKPR